VAKRPTDMTDSDLSCEYFILSFVPSVLSDESVPIGILLWGIESASSEKSFRFAGVRFVQELQALPVVDRNADETLIKEAIIEIQSVVERACASGQQNELSALVEQLLNANSGLCAFGPHPYRAVVNLELELQDLFERFIRRLP